MGNEIGKFLFEHVSNVYMQDADGPVLTIFIFDGTFGCNQVTRLPY